MEVFRSKAHAEGSSERILFGMVFPAPLPRKLALLFKGPDFWITQHATTDHTTCHQEKPKKLTFLGSDGLQYPFLCKAEKRGDLRKAGLAVVRFAFCAWEFFSPNCGQFGREGAFHFRAGCFVTGFLGV